MAVTRRCLLRALGAALPAFAARGAPKLAVGRLPDGRRLYRLNRIAADEPVHWAVGGDEPWNCPPHPNAPDRVQPPGTYPLRLAECVDEVNGEVVPAWPRTRAVFPGEHTTSAEALRVLRCWYRIDADQVIVTPEAEAAPCS